MRYTFVFGAPVHGSDKQLGKLTRIIVDNGIANQITVDPGLFGTERVVPISSLRESTADAIHTTLTDNDWKACASYTIDQLPEQQGLDPADLSVLTPNSLAGTPIRGTSDPIDQIGAYETERTVSDMSMVLTAKTAVADAANNTSAKLHGLIVDTGRPIGLILDNDQHISFDRVTLLDEHRIETNSTRQQPLLDADRGYPSTTTDDPLGDQRR